MMDSIDERIVRLLYQNGRLSQEQIAREVSLSRPAVHERIKRLEEQGVLKGYRAVVDWAALGQPMIGFVWVRTSGARCDLTGAEIMHLRCEGAAVEECHRVTGDWCMLLKVRAASPLGLQNLIDKIREVGRVTGTHTIIVLSTLSEHGSLGDDMR